MPRDIERRKSFPARTLGVIGGAAIFAFIVERAGPSTLLHNMVALRWALVLVLALAGISHALRTWGWQLTLGNHKRATSFLRLAALRLGAEAAGQLGFIGQMFGDATRISLLGDGTPIADRVSSVTLERGLFMIAGALVSAAGAGAALVIFPLPPAVRTGGGLFLLSVAALVFFSAVALQRRLRVLSASARFMCRLPGVAKWIHKRSSAIYQVEEKLLGFHRDFPISFWTAFALNLACHVLAVLEVYIILRALGFNIGFFRAFFIEALTKLVNFAGALSPGNVGSYEGGNVLIARLFRLSTGIGLTLGVARRLRSLFWAAVGGLCLIVLSRNGKRKHITMEANRMDSSKIAVVIANEANDHCRLLTRIGTVPLLLRTILGLHKAGAARIIVLVDDLSGNEIALQMNETGRVPQGVEWWTIRAGTPLSERLNEIVTETQTQLVVLVNGDTIYDPALLRKATEWTEQTSGLALTTGERPVGIYALPPELLQQKSDDIEELHSFLKQQEVVSWLDVDGGKWQRVRTSEDTEKAERKLNRWLIKPTDGFFAQMNRRVSIPISRQLIRLPITPNMVSLFTLGVSFASGAFFACGGYVNTLAGAALSIAASILDGCDGEVARLKIQDSAFGCWLETVCDYLSYVFVFAGLTVGLTRSSGSSIWLTWGAVLLTGAVMTFLATAFSRHRLARQRPEDLLRIWQKEAESRKANPLLFIGRRTEFLVRRCFMPYAVLVFALLNLTQLLFILCAVGSHAAWIISLYSCLVFRSSRPRRAVTATPAAAIST